MKKSILTLAILGVISALLLSFVYKVTTPIIAERQEEDKKVIILTVLPESDNYKRVEKNGIVLYEGNKEGEVAMIASGPGFGGTIELIVGANPFQRKLYAVKVLSHSETPGLGSHITGEEFAKNFIDKPFGDYQVVKRTAVDPLEVEAITGATVSSEMVVNIVKNAMNQMLVAYGFDPISVTSAPITTGATDASTGASVTTGATDTTTSATDTSTSATDTTTSATDTATGATDTATSATVTDTTSTATVTDTASSATVTTGATDAATGATVTTGATETTGVTDTNTSATASTTTDTDTGATSVGGEG